MALSNNERQARYRAKARELSSKADLMDRLVNGWRERRSLLTRELEMLETGLMRTGLNLVDDTDGTIARVREHIAELDSLVDAYSKSGAEAAHTPP